MVIQTAAIAVLVLYFSGRAGFAYVFTAVYVAILGVLMGGYTPMPVLTFLQSMCVPVVTLGKVSIPFEFPGLPCRLPFIPYTALHSLDYHVSLSLLLIH